MLPLLPFFITSTFIEFADLEFVERVGKGGPGQVWKGKWKSKNMTVAIKVMDLPDTEVCLWSDHHSSF